MASVQSQPPSRNHRLTPGDVRSSGSVFGQSAESGGSSAWAGSGGRHQATKWARQSTGPAFRGSGSSSLRFPPKALFRSLYEVAYTCRELILGGESGRGREGEGEGGGRGGEGEVGRGEGGFPEASGNGNCSCRPSAEGLPRTCVASERGARPGRAQGATVGWELFITKGLSAHPRCGFCAPTSLKGTKAQASFPSYPALRGVPSKVGRKQNTPGCSPTPDPGRGLPPAPVRWAFSISAPSSSGLTLQPHPQR